MYTVHYINFLGLHHTYKKYINSSEQICCTMYIQYRYIRMFSLIFKFNLWLCQAQQTVVLPFLSYHCPSEYVEPAVKSAIQNEKRPQLREEFPEVLKELMDKSWHQVSKELYLVILYLFNFLP